MNLSKEGEALIKTLSPHESTAFKDSSGRWTIGFGHRSEQLTALCDYIYNDQGKPPTKKDAAWLECFDTELEDTVKLKLGTAYTLLSADIERAEKVVADAISVEISQKKFDALVSFEHDTRALAGSEIADAVNAGEDKKAGHLLMTFDKVRVGKTLQMATSGKRSRQMEAALFSAPDDPVAPPSDIIKVEPYADLEQRDALLAQELAFDAMTVKSVEAAIAERDAKRASNL